MMCDGLDRDRVTGLHGQHQRFCRIEVAPEARVGVAFSLTSLIVGQTVRPVYERRVSSTSRLVSETNRDAAIPCDQYGEATTPSTSSPLDHCWYAIVDAACVADGAYPFEVLGVSFVMWRTDEGLVAVRDRCSHREAPSSLGTVDDGCLRCPYHGWTFGAEGRCLGVP